MGNTIDRVKAITEILADHQRKQGIRDMDVHCTCGWSGPGHQGLHKDHQARHIEAALDSLNGTPVAEPGVLEGGGSAAGELNPPARPLAADPSSPPRTDLRDDLIRLAERWKTATINRTHVHPSDARIYGDGVEDGYERAADDLRDLLAAHPQTDGGAGTPSGDQAEPVDEATPTPAPSSLDAVADVLRKRMQTSNFADNLHEPLRTQVIDQWVEVFADAVAALLAPSSLTDRMRVERCRVLLDRWRKDRLYSEAVAPVAPAAYGRYTTLIRCENELREALESP